MLDVLILLVLSSVADPDQVGSGPFWIRACIKLHYLNFLVCVKATNTLGSSVVNIFSSYIFTDYISDEKNSRRNLNENLSMAGSESGKFQKLDPDPIKNCPDPHLLK
jgi:hypothetical protein